MKDKTGVPPNVAKILDDARQREEKAAQEAAEEWLVAESKRSQEGLAKRAAEKNTVPPPNEGAVIEALSRKPDIEYDRMRGPVAETLGIRVRTLDDQVDAVREARATLGNEPAHWSVEPAAEPVEGATLLEDLRKHFRRHVVLPPSADIAIPLWILHAWTHEFCEISPILTLTSPTKRCGKTHTMILLMFLTPRSELAANVSTASIFRYIEAERPTLLIDEADTFPLRQ